MLEILGKPSMPCKPREGALDDPAFGQDDKSFYRDGSQHRLQYPAEGLADPLGQTMEIQFISPMTLSVNKPLPNQLKHPLAV